MLALARNDVAHCKKMCHLLIFICLDCADMFRYIFLFVCVDLMRLHDLLFSFTACRVCVRFVCGYARSRDSPLFCKWHNSVSTQAQGGCRIAFGYACLRTLDEIVS